jgi:hypothetical protein
MSLPGDQHPAPDDCPVQPFLADAPMFITARTIDVESHIVASSARQESEK